MARLHPAAHAEEVSSSKLSDAGVADNTIVVMTAGRGELGGAHGTHGKGATAYREQNNVPLIVSHPGYPNAD